MLHFKKATLHDTPIWSQFRNDLYGELGETFDIAEMRRITEDPKMDAYLVFLKNENRPIGLIELSLRDFVDECASTPVAYIEGLYLVKAHRGKGLGKQLVGFIKKWAGEQGSTELAVDAELENEKAQQFYLREGFQETSRIVQFKINL